LFSQGGTTHGLPKSTAQTLRQIQDFQQLVEERRKMCTWQHTKQCFQLPFAGDHCVLVEWKRSPRPQHAPTEKQQKPTFLKLFCHSMEMPLTPFWQFQQTCQRKMRKNEVQNFKRKFRNHDPESYQTNKGFNRNSATEMPGAPGAANSVEMSGSMYELDVVMIFLKVPCSCRNCLRSGSGCREQIHWCDTNAALPM